MDHKSILRTYLLKILLPCELSRLGNTSSIRTLQKRMLVKWSREEKLSCVQCAACRPGHPRPWALTMGTYFQWHGQKLWLNNLLDTISLKFWFMTFGGSFADTRPLWPIPMTVAVGCKYFFYIFFVKLINMYLLLKIWTGNVILRLFRASDLRIKELVRLRPGYEPCTGGLIAATIIAHSYIAKWLPCNCKKTEVCS